MAVTLPGLELTPHNVGMGTEVVIFRPNRITGAPALGLNHQVEFADSMVHYRQNKATPERSVQVAGGRVELALAIARAPILPRIISPTIQIDVVTLPAVPGDTAVEIVYRIPGRLRLRPRLLAPPNRSQDRLAQPVMRWIGTVEAEYYEVHVALDDQFTQRVARYNVFGTSVQRGLPFGATYWWRVRAVAGAAWSDYSEVWSFTVPPILPAPEAAHELAGRSRLLWQFREDA